MAVRHQTVTESSLIDDPGGEQIGCETREGTSGPDPDSRLYLEIDDSVVLARCLHLVEDRRQAIRLDVWPAATAVDALAWKRSGLSFE